MEGSFGDLTGLEAKWTKRFHGLDRCVAAPAVALLAVACWSGRQSAPTCPLRCLWPHDQVLSEETDVKVLGEAFWGQVSGQVLPTSSEPPAHATVRGGEIYALSFELDQA